MENRRDKSTELPIFTSDDWDAYKNALVDVYGVEEQPEYKGRGRPHNPKKVRILFKLKGNSKKYIPNHR
ncbi:hypothetical protein C5S35_14415 [Candidatus Methanophagaceae archaeon]|nr:hypothetical protein C5S35_14415 [Methanophagales archaeon]